MTVDAKPVKRIRDPKVFKDFHNDWPDCVACGGRPVHAHHGESRSRGGDDTRENLLGLCTGCHRVYHDGGSYRGAFGKTISAGLVQSAIGRYIDHESGEDTRRYVLRKLGPVKGADWLYREFGILDA